MDRPDRTQPVNFLTASISKLKYEMKIIFEQTKYPIFIFVTISYVPYISKFLLNVNILNKHKKYFFLQIFHVQPS